VTAAQGNVAPRPLQRYVLASQASTAQVVAMIVRTCFADGRSLHDATWGDGGFLEGSLLGDFDVTGTDLEPARCAPNGVADVRCLPLGDGERDVVLFDPPHSADSTNGIMASRYGSYTQAELERLVRQGTAECWRCARIGIVVKVTDCVHGQRYVAMSDWVRSALDWQPLYERVDYVRPTNLEDPRWTTNGEPCSARSNGSTFLVFRHGSQRHVRRGRRES
jgi:hypothetical protein